jgi:hypothetical protein
VKVAVFVLDRLEPVELGSFDSEAAALAAIKLAQAQGIVVRSPEEFSVIPWHRVRRYILTGAPVAKAGPKRK